MAISREKKEQIVSELEEKFKKSLISVFTNYRGLNVEEVSGLRKKMREKEIDYRVAKNTLFRLAFKNTEMKVDESILNQPIAAAFGYRDEVDPPKIINDFAKEHENLEILGGIIEGKYVPREEILELANLPTREELYAKIVGSLASPFRGLVSVLQGNLRGLVSVLNQYKDQITENS